MCASTGAPLDSQAAIGRSVPRLWKVLVIGCSLTAVLCGAAVVVYWGVPDGRGISVFDRAVLDTMVSWRTPLLDSMFTTLTNVAGEVGMVVLALCALVVLSYRYRSWQPALFLVACGTGSVLLTIALKGLLNRPRPPHSLAVPPYEYSGSFPSGHTLNAVVITGAIAYLLVLQQRRISSQVVTIGISVLFCLTIGVSRIFLGHHWCTDVLGGMLLGLAWLTCMITVHQWILARAQAGAHALPGSLIAVHERGGPQTVSE